MLFLLLVAGHETTVNLIATGTLALLTHPAELARLRVGARRCCRARSRSCCATPTRSTTRPSGSRTEPLEIGGVTIPAREWVLCVTSSANRDPDRFPDPDRLDVGRDAGGHVAFGHGIHYCLGAPLARLEGEIAFGALLSRFPAMSLAVDPADAAVASELAHPRPGDAARPARLTRRKPARLGRPARLGCERAGHGRLRNRPRSNVANCAIDLKASADRKAQGW